MLFVLEEFNLKVFEIMASNPSYDGQMVSANQILGLLQQAISQIMAGMATAPPQPSQQDVEGASVISGASSESSSNTVVIADLQKRWPEISSIDKKTNPANYWYAIHHLKLKRVCHGNSLDKTVKLADR